MTINFSDFYDASQARNISAGGGSPLGDILTEINAIKVNIDTVAPAGGLSVTITDSTTMTMSTAYYNAWNDVLLFTDDASVLARLRMDAVVRFFSSLGFRVQRQRETTQNRFQWVISW